MIFCRALRDEGHSCTRGKLWTRQEGVIKVSTARYKLAMGETILQAAKSILTLLDRLKEGRSKTT